MKVKVYVNWRSREVINEKEFEKLVEETFEDYKGDQDYFSEWLADNYEVVQVWEMNEEERIKTIKAFEEKCLSVARKEMLYDWEENELDV